MTQVRKSVVAVLAGMVATLGAAQAQVGSAGQWQRMLELGEAHEMASGPLPGIERGGGGPGCAPPLSTSCPTGPGSGHTRARQLWVFFGPVRTVRDLS